LSVADRPALIDRQHTEAAARREMRRLLCPAVLVEQTADGVRVITSQGVNLDAVKPDTPLLDAVRRVCCGAGPPRPHGRQPP
jgi:hypothetical protein